MPDFRGVDLKFIKRAPSSDFLRQIEDNQRFDVRYNLKKKKVYRYDKANDISTYKIV